MASNLRITSAGKSEVLLYSVDDGMAGLFVQASIIDSGGTVTATADLTENGSFAGQYRGTVTISIEGVYDVIYIPYTDSGHTNESERAPRASEVWQVRLTADQYAGARPGATGGLVDDDVKLFVEEVKKLLPKETKEDIKAILEKLLDEKLKQIDFKPKIEVKAPRVTVKPTPVTVKPIIRPTPVTVNPTPVTVKPTPITVKPTPVTVNPASVTVKPTDVKVDAPVVNPTPITVKAPIVNPTPVNIDLSKIENKQSELQETLKGIAEDIANIQQKEGIVGASQKIIKQLMS